MIILWPETAPSPIYETNYSYSFCRDVTKDLTQCELANYQPDTTIQKAFGTTDSLGPICIVRDPEIIISHSAIETMERAIQQIKGVAGPLFNLSDYPGQVASLPYPYVDKFTFAEVAELINKDKNETYIEVANLDPAVVAIHPDVLQNVSRSCPLAELVEIPSVKVVCSGAFVHKFGDYYSAQREDLVDLVPDEVTTVLDIGCARGGYGQMLKTKRPDVHITGVELNPNLAKEAVKIYDKVIQLPLEKADIDMQFDLINMGDVLEHLYDPWEMLAKTTSLLRPGGWLVGSVPNSGHWSIVRQLSMGELEYIPVGLLCISHIRFFTESSLQKSLEDTGYQIEYFERLKPAPTPEGQKIIELLVNTGVGNHDSLLTAELVFRAKLKR